MTRTNTLLWYLSRGGGLTPPHPETDGQLLGLFLDRRDEAAFAALMARHGPMVWGVCRRMLSDHQDAEDAFQATFLVLARKGRTVKPRERVGNWLYGVARHAAHKARSERMRRRIREREAATMPEPPAPDQTEAVELTRWLDEELSRLPPRYRSAVVLCDLEGRALAEAARHLGCPVGTVASRLARARAMLAKRLARHGLTIGPAALAATLAGLAEAGALPARVVRGVLDGISTRRPFRRGPSHSWKEW